MHRHFILVKPYGYLSQFVTNQAKQQRKKLLGDLYDFPEATMAIGRLDEKSEGILLLSTDGQMSEAVRSAKVEKEYYVQVDGIATPAHVEHMAAGVEIGIHGRRYLTQACEVSLLEPAPAFGERRRRIRDARHGPTSWMRVVLREGKFRQVRKMTAAVGLPTLRLVRVRVGGHRLGNRSWGVVEEVESFRLG